MDTTLGGGATPFLTAQAHHSSGTVVVSIQGELDLASAATLERELRSLFALPVEQVTVDFGGVTFMDSTGLSMLVRVHSTASDQDIALVIRDVPPQAMRIFEITGMTEFFTI